LGRLRPGGRLCAGTRCQTPPAPRRLEANTEVQQQVDARNVAVDRDDVAERIAPLGSEAGDEAATLQRNGEIGVQAGVEATEDIIPATKVTAVGSARIA